MQMVLLLTGVHKGWMVRPLSVRKGWVVGGGRHNPSSFDSQLVRTGTEKKAFVKVGGWVSSGLIIQTWANHI